MDKYEATKVVMTRIQGLDPENASKIMGYILIQDKGEKEMIRLAFVPEPLLLSCIEKAKACLGISSSNPFPLNTPRILIPNNGFRNFSNPSSPAAAAAAFQVNSPRPFSYAAALNGSTGGGGGENGSGSPGVHFYGGDEFGSEFPGGGRQVQDRLSFFDDPMSDPVMSPGGMSDSLVFPYGEDANGVPSPHPFHRRSCSVNDAAFLSNILEDNGGGNGFGWRPCMYFARGFCKNGSSCKFLHVDIAAGGGGGGGGGEGIDVGSPGYNNSGFDELLRMKALQQQRFAAMAAAGGGGGGGGHHPFGYNKCMDFLNENPRSALMMGDESHKYNRFRPDRNDFSMMANSSARQIYLTFPADSSFKEDDVSNYFSIFGPVQDVRIPYQQKRMFGFVTFVFSETVKLILAKGNPHFVCDSRVLVKPYKEKGKVPDKKQHLERGEFSSCLSPSAIDSREHIDLPFGSRMLFSPQEMMLRRKLEQEAELQHAIEIQSRRMMNLQLMELKQNHHHNNILHPSFISSPRQSQLPINQNFTNASDSFNQENSEAKFYGNEEAVKSPDFGGDEKLVLEKIESFTTNKQHCHVNGDVSNFSESFEDMLPENLFASPTKVAAENNSVFSEASSSTDDSTTTPLTISNNNMASLKSCYIQMPRFSSGQEAIEM
ncbi:hypothetical protein ABFX02_04G062600 [Erythranthe guttata]